MRHHVKNCQEGKRKMEKQFKRYTYAHMYTNMNKNKKLLFTVVMEVKASLLLFILHEIVNNTSRKHVQKQF